MSKVYGYCRVSTKKQALLRQVNNIRGEYPKAILYKEYYTGTKMDRPEWNRLLNVLRSDDTIVFDSVSRMSRDSKEGFRDYKRLYESGINLVFLKEPHINTDVFKASANKMIDMSISTGNQAIDEYFKGNIDLINKLLLDLAEQQIKVAFDQSEKEVLDLHQRISEGLRESKSNRIGLPRGTKIETKKAKTCKQIILKHSKTFGGELSDEEVIRLCGCSKNSYYKYKAEIRTSDDM